MAEAAGNGTDVGGVTWEALLDVVKIGEMPNEDTGHSRFALLVGLGSLDAGSIALGFDFHSPVATHLGTVGTGVTARQYRGVPGVLYQVL